MANREAGALSNTKAVIFDYGEVLCHPPSASEIESIANMFDLSREKFRALWIKNRDQFDRGDISSEVYWRKFAEDAGRPIDEEVLRDLAERDVAMWSAVNPEMIAWIEELWKAGIKTAVLSNMHADMADYARRNFRWLAGLNCVTLSAEVRAIKPHPEIYEHCLRGLKTSPAETLFIDDREVNVKAAEAMGIHGIQFKSLPQLRQELEAEGFPVLPPAAKTPPASANN
jgi:putative hydrolase of the HAD superfamily